MPQLIGIALLGGVLWYGYRLFKREMKRADQQVCENERKRKNSKHGQKLVKGKDGVYRPDDPERD